MMKKGLLVYNPHSGKNPSKKLESVMKRFNDNNIEIEPYKFEADGDRLATALNNSNCDFIVLAGGDGTVNHGVNVLLKNKINIPIGLIPSGTANDFARSLGLPKEPEKCVDVIIKGNVKKVDVGLVNKDQYFLSTFGGGMFMGVSFDSSIMELKKKFGPVAYYMKGLTEMINLKSFPLKIKTEKGTIKEDAFLFLIINGQHAGGFSYLLRAADMSDGVMDIIIVKKCMHIDLTRMFLKMFNSNAEANENVYSIQAKKCSITIPSDTVITIDGEKGKSVNSTVEFLKEKISVFVDL